MARVKPPNPPYVGPAAHTSEGNNLPPTRIVVHSTVSGSEPGTARNVAAYFRDPKSGGSCHYVVDAGETVQVVGDSKIAWHAPPNARSIGIEMCDYPTWSRKRWFSGHRRKVFRRTARLCAHLCAAYDVPPRRVHPSGLRASRKGYCGHRDVSKAFRQSTHWDPGAFAWVLFRVRVRAHYRRLMREASN